MPPGYNPLDTYLQEAEDLLAQIEQCALALAEGRSTPETIHQLFRAFHTIKGSGAMCGLDRVARFTHHVETALDLVRGGATPALPNLSGLILSAGDHIRALLGAETGGNPPAAESDERLIAAFGDLFPEQSGQGTTTEASVQVEPVRKASTAETSEWQIEFRPDHGILACGGNPALLFRELSEMGPCEVVAHTDNIPGLEEIHPDACYLWWTVRLRTAAGRDAIRDVFIFVEDGSRIEINELPSAPAPARVAAPPAPDAGDRTVQRAGEAAARTLAKESTVRVPSSRLDRLVNLVGELVMTQSRLAQAARHSFCELANPLQELERLVAELRDDVLGIRMLPIGTIFGRFRRVVHDVSSELGKDVELITTGAETELDKSILDQIGEPLVHLLRNAIDHGVESPEERARQNKPRRGAIRLSAEHAGPAVVVSIEDDGRGIDRNAVRRKAVERGLIAPDAVLSDQEVFSLILQPGFSTAREVTSISGRGVGMDVVKKQLDALRGAVVITSEPGKGTRVALTLPLTLAIIEGLLVEIGPDQVILPMPAVLENVELHRSERERNNGRNILSVRGEPTPYIDLREVLETGGEAPAVERVVIVRHGDQRVGLVVDRVVGAHQAVIQSLSRFFRKAKVVSGATIMGDGRVALIVDVPAVVERARRREADGQSHRNS
jgi:two-component system chemotaxis sensor kinase CheA